MTAPTLIRTASESDAAALREIYRPFVERTAVSFEVEVPSVAELARRIAAAVEGWAWLVAEVEGEAIGYAYASGHRTREAYRYSVETSAYVREDFRRQGVARALYEQLLDDLVEQGFGSAYAGITLPNAASVGFHESLGFTSIGVFPRVGRKFGRWHDVLWLYRPLNDSVRD